MNGSRLMDVSGSKSVWRLLDGLRGSAGKRTARLLAVAAMLSLCLALGVVPASAGTRPKASGGRAQVAAGKGHAVVVKSDGTLWAWGLNYYGQLGDGMTTDRTSPVQVGTDNKWYRLYMPKSTAYWPGTSAMRTVTWY